MATFPLLRSFLKDDFTHYYLYHHSRLWLLYVDIQCFCERENSFLRDLLSNFPVVFSPTSDYIVRPLLITVPTTNNNHDFTSSSRFSQEVFRDLPWVPKRDYLCAVSDFCRRPKTRRAETSPQQPIAARGKKTPVPRVLEISRPV